jgi:uncharacterized protein (TIRG00374 family)
MHIFKIFLGVISFFIGAAIFWFVISSVGIGEVVKGLFEFSLWGLIPLIVLTGIVQVIGAYKWQYVLRNLGASVPLGAIVKVFLVGNALSYITPVVYVGGEAVRGYILRERYGVPWERGLASIAIDKISEAAIWVLVICVGVVVFLWQSQTSWASNLAITLLAFMGLMAVSIALLYFFSFKKKSIVRPLLLRPFHLEGSRTGHLLCDIENEFFKFFSAANRKQNIGVAKILLVKYAFILLRNLFLIYYLQGVFSLTGSIITAGFSHISYALPIPAALGVQEGALSLVFAGLGASAGLGIAFALLLRAADSIVASIGLLFLLRWGLGKFILHVLRRMKIHSDYEKDIEKHVSF